MAEDRIVSLNRDTNETRIALTLNLDGTGVAEIATGIPFFDHMLDLFAKHGLFDLEIKAVGDVEVDYHHTVEDLGLVLGQAVKEAVGEKLGLQRYGFFILPMDECLTRVAIDLGGRSALVYRVEAREQMVRDFNIGLVKEFFQSFANKAAANVHINLEYGEEPHHIAESVFKCFARALDGATRIDARREGSLPSTKGIL